jgi:ABC-type transport system involved in multi-copper enzyme maturation permease subunit
VRFVLLIARDTVRSIRRHRVLLAFLLLSVAGFALASIGMRNAAREIDRASRITAKTPGAPAAPETSEPTVMAPSHVQMVVTLNGLFSWGMSLAGSLLALVLFGTVVATEIQTGTIRVILSKPVPRWAYLSGRWLGAAIILAAWSLIAGTACVALAATSGMSGTAVMVTTGWLSFCGNLVFGTVALALSLYFRTPVAGVLAWFASAAWFDQLFPGSVVLYAVLPSYEPFDVSGAMLGIAPSGLAETTFATLYAVDVVVIAALVAFARFRRMEIA